MPTRDILLHHLEKRSYTREDMRLYTLTSYVLLVSAIDLCNIRRVAFRTGNSEGVTQWAQHTRGTRMTAHVYILCT